MYAQYCRLHVHVYASNREVIRKAQRMLKRSCRYSREFRTARHAWLRSLLGYHARAAKEYREVMGGHYAGR